MIPGDLSLNGRDASSAFHEPPTPSPGGLEAAALAYRDFLQCHDPTDPKQLDSWCESFHAQVEHAQLFRDVHRSNPSAAYQLAEGLTALPEVGTEFLGFRLVAELGRGAFGRVYLARQGDLANRPVALKVATDILGESQTLAQLQHTNIVPIYSLHRAGPLQAVCMPYFGSTTLADVLRDLGRRDSLPLSGKGLLSTLYGKRLSAIGYRLPDVGHRLSAIGNRLLPDAAAIENTPVPVKAPEPLATGEDPKAESREPGADATVTLRMLEGLTYVEAVLWIGARLADGLSHAHERGVLHRDLKPANVLLTDDGTPMLLDFNLAADSRVRDGATASLVGGTLPYMAPEHLDAFRGGSRLVDARSDIYALGIILYELLTGRYPFGRFHGPLESILPRMIEERSRAVPPVRPYNRAVTPAVESIVRHCLNPDPAQRYQSAADLREDLERQLRNEPLRHAPEVSLTERALKFHRRHPRVAPATLAAVLLGALVAGGTFLVQRAQQAAEDLERRGRETAAELQRSRAETENRGREAARLAALNTRNRFAEELRTARQMLSGRSGDRQQRADGRVIAQRALGRYQVLDNPSAWQELPAFTQLAPDDQGRVRNDLGELLLLLAGSEMLDASGGDPLQSSKQPLSASPDHPLRKALKLNELAEKCYGSDQSPRALWLQRVSLVKQLGRTDEVKALRERADRVPVRDAWEQYLMARELAQQGLMREARDLLLEVVTRDPQNFGAWYILGNCSLDGLARESDAIGHYTVCIALWPEFYGSYFNRGLAQLRRRNFSAAETDFTRALERRPSYADTLVHRALARQGLKQYRQAVADLDEALKLGAPGTRVYFMRSRLWRHLGDTAAAQRDLDEGLRREPTDDIGWIARGLARIDKDPQGALADFQKGAQLNPRSLAGLQNQASVLSERLGRTEEAIAALDKLLGIYPTFVPALAGRGVLRARLGQRDAAHADARLALTFDDEPATQYQVAGIYALTAKDRPDDRREALRLLGKALRQGYGLDLLEKDSDLDPLRDDPQFKELVRAAQALRGKTSDR